jgi:5,10-methylenetetrahydromethanopterin reductase
VTWGMMDFSLQLLPEQPLAELIDVVRLADELGFRGCYSADETYHKDMWILFGAAAPGTRRIRFGPEVSGVILRDPTLIAQQAATLDELTGGRAEIVFSIGNIAMLDQYGVRWQGTRPLARLREAHEIMRTFLAEGHVDFQGEFYRYSGLFTAARPVQQPLPIKIGAMTGPGSFRLAGEIADGIHVACAYSSEALSSQLRRFAKEQTGSGADSTAASISALPCSVRSPATQRRRRRRPAWPRPSISHRWHLSSSSGTGSTMRTFGQSSTPLVAGMSSARWS